MRDFGVVHTRFWPWAQENGLNDTERTIAVYALSCEHSNSLGCFRLPKTYVAEDLGYTIDRVSKGYEKLIEREFLAYCETTKYVHIQKYLVWNPPQNPKHAKGIIKLAKQIPKKSQIVDSLIYSLYIYGGRHINYTVCYRLWDTLCKPYGYTDPDPDTDKDTDTDSPPNPPAGVSIPFKKILSSYHSNLSTLPTAELDSELEKQILARWKAGKKRQCIEWWDWYFKGVAKVDFLVGKNDRGWIATLQWLTGPKNMSKVLNGNYNNGKPMSQNNIAGLKFLEGLQNEN